MNPTTYRQTPPPKRSPTFRSTRLSLSRTSTMKGTRGDHNEFAFSSSERECPKLPSSVLPLLVLHVMAVLPLAALCAFPLILAMSNWRRSYCATFLLLLERDANTHSVSAQQPHIGQPSLRSLPSPFQSD